MKYDIKPTLKGISVTDGETKYLFKNKLFSLSSVLEDEHGKIAASLKRTGWWHLTFALSTEKESYKLEQKWGEVTVTSINTGKCFRTNLTTDFYNNKNDRVTEFSKAERFGFLYKLIIKDTEHNTALLMASCLLYKTSIEGNG